MKNITVTASLYVTAEGGETLDFEVHGEGMNDHEHIASLTIILGYEMGKCTIGVAEKLNLPSELAFKKAFKDYEKCLVHGYNLARQDSIKNKTERITSEKD